MRISATRAQCTENQWHSLCNMLYLGDDRSASMSGCSPSRPTTCSGRFWAAATGRPASMPKPRGARVVSVDPLYAHSVAEIGARIDATYGEILEQTRRNLHEFVWSEFTSVEELGNARIAAMNDFLADFDTGRRAGRYLAAGLPDLLLADRSFELALCSHFLFLYSAQLGEAFHVESVVELCRVAEEVRLFPLLQLGGAPSPHVAPVVRAVERFGRMAKIEAVPYEFQRGANQMMRIQRR